MRMLLCRACRSMAKAALLLGHFQQDFAQDDAALAASTIVFHAQASEQLPCMSTAATVDVVNQLRRCRRWDLVVHVVDWHPANCRAFADNCPVRSPLAPAVCVCVCARDEGDRTLMRCVWTWSHDEVKGCAASPPAHGAVATRGQSGRPVKRFPFRLSPQVLHRTELEDGPGPVEHDVTPSHCLQV
jgi:hypothetical protein